MTPGEDRRPAAQGAGQALGRAREDPSTAQDRRERARLGKEELRRRLRSTGGAFPKLEAA